ncbi:unnamed protein product [Paramecium pentaurelia]|uniref:Transmembrane protein n=1 Tax=Paramecium pentaurelia TaxID=43138 RepID=A0A8S1YIF1_9CILI|nr:unnamed protein product [Paramecium pentaurelia]
MKYMQYQFPPHLIEFLNTQTKVSLQPVMNYFRQINYLQNQMVVLLQIKSLKNRIKNLKKCFKWVLFGQCQKLLFFCHCIINNLFTLYSQCLNNLKFRFYAFQSQKEQCQTLQTYRFFRRKNLEKSAQHQKLNISLGIYKVYQAILHYLLFSESLQFPNYKFNNTFEILNSFNAILGLSFILMATFPLLSITSAQIKDIRKWKYFYYESKTQFLTALILFYILIVVQFINYREAQSILLSMLSFMYLIFLVKFKLLHIHLSFLNQFVENCQL